MDFTGKRVFVVEDNALNMEIACMLFRDFALKNKSPCSACEFQAKQGISILGIKLLFFSV